MTAAADPRQPDRPLVVQSRLIVALVLRGLVSEISPRNGGVFGLLFRPAFIILMLYGVYSLFHRLTLKARRFWLFWSQAGWAGFSSSGRSRISSAQTGATPS